MPTMSKNRISFLVDTAIEIANQELALTPNSIATAMQWNQSSLTRAMVCREVTFPERVGRASLTQLVYDAFMVDDQERLAELRALIARLSNAKSCDLPEAYLPPAEPEDGDGEPEDTEPPVVGAEVDGEPEDDIF